MLDNYNFFKNYGNFHDSTMSFARNGRRIFKVKGMLTPKGIILAPSKEIPLKEGDTAFNDKNKYIVTNIYHVNYKGSWDIYLESWIDYKQKSTNRSITTNVSNSSFNQNIGKGNKIHNAQHTTTNKSINNITKIIPKIQNSFDRRQLLELARIFKDIKDHKKEPKKGFLKKFDLLLGKYPNVTNVVSNLLLQWAETGFIH